ncbi:MAG TPA: acyltransferase [Verrucomicrobiae bacterium]|nr:acyltransferase [Verrucomicrobiae bacterium]
MQNIKRFEYIDALRGIAMLCVVLSHAAGAVLAYTSFGAAEFTILRNLGAMGFRLFFVISSFCIFYTLERHTREERRPVRNFFIRRFFRIAPVFWFGIVLYTGIFGWTGPRWGPEHPELWHYPLFVFFLCLLHPQTHTTVVPGGWSVSAEMLFYTTLPFLFKFIRNLATAACFCVFCVFMLTWATWMLRPYVEQVVFAGLPQDAFAFYWDRFPLILLGGFSFGILLFYLQRSEKLMKLVTRPEVSLAMTIVSSVCIGLLAVSNLWFLIRPHFYCLCFTVLALALSTHPWRFFVNGFTVFLGRISYSTYLLHFLVLRALVEWVPPHAPEIVMNPPSAFFVLLAGGTLLTMPLAWLSFILIEQPAIRLGNRIIAPDKQPGAVRES